MVRVLVPLDGSARSLTAMQEGLAKLKGGKPDVTLFVVVQDGFASAGADRIEAFEADENDEIFPTEASARPAFDEARQLLDQLGIKSNVKTVRGRVRDAIVAESAEHDILLMHALPQRRISNVIRMSNTLWLARNAKCPVLLAGT